MNSIMNLQNFSITVNNTNYSWFWNVYNKKQWEPHTLKVLDRILEKDHIYVDIGSWIGPTVLYAANLCKKCYAVEPDLQAFNELTLNVNLNPNLNIECFNLLIGDKDGLDNIVSYTNFGDSMSTIQSAPAHGGNLISTEVSSLTLETFINNINEDIKLIKIDIEGSECVVLKNSYEFIKSTAPNIYISLHPTWFGEDEDFQINTRNIINVVKIYNKVFDGNMNKISIEQISNVIEEKKHGIDLLLTNTLDI